MAFGGTQGQSRIEPGLPSYVYYEYTPTVTHNTDRVEIHYPLTVELIV